MYMSPVWFIFVHTVWTDLFVSQQRQDYKKLNFYLCGKEWASTYLVENELNIAFYKVFTPYEHQQFVTSVYFTDILYDSPTQNSV